MTSHSVGLLTIPRWTFPRRSIPRCSVLRRTFQCRRRRRTEQVLSNTGERQAMVAAFNFEIWSLSNVLRTSVGDKLQENRAYCLTPDSHIRSRVDCSIFESGLIASVATSFPDAHHRGCHFHSCRAIYCKVQALGLTTAYDTDTEARLETPQLMALAFLPVAVVRLTFGTLETMSMSTLQPLFQYFRQQWSSVALLSTAPHVSAPWNVRRGTQQRVIERRGKVQREIVTKPFRRTGNMRLLYALIRRKLPVGPDAPDADAPDAYYPYPILTYQTLNAQLSLLPS